MPTIRFDSLAAAGKDIQARLHELPVVVRKGMRSAALYGEARLSKATPVDQGQLKNSWHTKLDTLDASGVDEIVNEAPHAGIVERGARPHPVSQEGWWAIYRWVVRHGLGSDVMPAADENGVVVDEFAAITWGIVNKLRTHGQKPTYFVRENLPAIAKMVRSEVRRELQKFAGRPARGRGRK